jgi:hypothetical protein
VTIDWDPELGAPHVSVDLRGHTLRGPGSGRGIATVTSLNPTFVTLSNGRLEGWEYGVIGTNDTRVSRVTLAGNQYGYFCNGFCAADRVRFEGADIGMVVGAEASVLVTRSAFVGNQEGARDFALSGLTIEDSVFRGNVIGAHQGGLAWMQISGSDFRSNQTAILVEDPDAQGICVELHKDKFQRNDADVVGTIC